MTKANKTQSRSDKLLELSRGAFKGAALLPEGRDQNAALDASKMLKSMAEKDKRKEVTEAHSAVLELSSNATNSELRAARIRRAARRGKDVYLPAWSDVACGLPNALLRSALFSAAQVDRSEDNREALRLDDATIATFGDISVVYSGYQLSRYDLRVFAACLSYYRDRPLSPTSGPHHVQVSYYEFAKLLGRSYSPDVYIAVRESLLRLSKAYIRIRYKPKGGIHLDVEVPRLVSVTFADSYAGKAEGFNTASSNLLFLQVPESVADLFGPNTWTAVDTKVLSYKGLTGWLAAFYSTHNKPKWLPLTTLYNLSGLTCRPDNFVRQIKAALDELKDEATPEKSRIIRYYISEKSNEVWVCGASWKAAANLPPDGELPPDDEN